MVTPSPRRSVSWWGHNRNGIYLCDGSIRRRAARAILLAHLEFDSATSP
ncbi:hypothetical protein [Rhodococcus jostii]